MIDELRMAELLCTRLCHDLTGPIGAVNNGAEFLSEEGFNLQGQALELIVSSAFSAVTRLQFYRMAYGKVGMQGEANLAEKQKLATDFFSDSKISLDWPDSHTDAAGVSISQKMSRLILNLLVVTSSALNRGGTIAVRITPGDGGQRIVTLASHGPGLKWDGDSEKALAGTLTAEELTPKNVQTYLTKRFADDLGATLTCEVTGDDMLIRVAQPAAV